VNSGDKDPTLTADRLPARVEAVVAVAAALGLLLATAYRLHLGTNFTDEAFYLAVPYRFLLGDRMFVDEMNMLQFSSVFTFPLVAGWVRMFGTTGIFLFMRWMWLLFSCGVGAAAFILLRRYVRWPLALLASMVAVVVMPWGIPALSYNTLGTGFILAGCAVGALAVRRERSRLLVVSGIVHGLAVIVYPTLIVVVPIYLAIIAWSRKNDRLPWLGMYLLGGLGVGIPAAAALWWIGPANILATYRYSAGLGTQGGGVAKLAAVAIGFLRALAGERRLLVGMVVLVALRFVRPAWARWGSMVVAASLPLLLLSVAGFYNENRSMGLVTFWALAGIVAYAVLERDGCDQLVFGHLMAPSLVAGVVFAYSSNNGYVNAGIGLLAAALAASYFVARLVRRSGEAVGLRPEWVAVVALVPAAIFCALVVQFQYSNFYNDVPLAAQTERITAGPYAGLATGKANAGVIRGLQRDLPSATRSGDKILFFDGFPAGYLMTGLRPATNTVWLPSPTFVPQMDIAGAVRYFERSDIRPTVAVEVRLWGMAYPPTHPIVRYLADQGFAPVVTRPDYVILKSGSP
jgi:hypothetical protein